MLLLSNFTAFLEVKPTSKKLTMLKYNFFFVLFYRSYDDETESRWSKCKMCEYVFVLVLTIVLIFGSFGLLLFWIMKFRQGVLWEPQHDNDKLERYMNLHYVFMTAGFITIGGMCKYLPLISTL